MGSTSGLWYLDRAEFGMTLLEAETGGSRQRGWAGHNAQAVPARVSKNKACERAGRILGRRGQRCSAGLRNGMRKGNLARYRQTKRRRAGGGAIHAFLGL
ncbi:hypothetical protein BKA80DRAFT_280428, partial [Phyllosticta citrichinensis]